MDCPHYLEQLDAVRPGSTDHEDPVVREAVAHAAECERCSREFGARQKFDQRVAVRMRDVAIPADARERLLQRLDQGDSPEAAAVVPSTAALASWPFGILPTVITTTAAMLLVGVIGWYVSSRSNVTLTMDEVHDAVGNQFANVTDEQYTALDSFNGEFDPSIDDGRWKRVTNSTPRGIDLDGDGVHDAAVYSIRRPVPGLLLVLAPDLVVDPPSAMTPMGVTPRYGPVRVAWLPAGSSEVHLCVLPGDDDDLSRLLRFVIDSMAA